MRELTFRVNQMMYARERRRPTNEYVKECHALLGEELRMLEADELVANNLKAERPHR